MELNTLSNLSTLDKIYSPLFVINLYSIIHAHMHAALSTPEVIMGGCNANGIIILWCWCVCSIVIIVHFQGM